jgi:hypothetical protein
MEDIEKKQSQTFREVQDELAEWRERIERAAETDDKMRASMQNVKSHAPIDLKKECLIMRIKKYFLRDSLKKGM